MRLVAVFLLLLLATFSFATPLASAQSESPDDARARELYLLGDDLYSQGRYEEALAAFQESYDLSGRPLLLFNIANAQERSGQWQGAIESLEAYLPHADDAERSRIESRIASLRSRVERLEQMQTDETPTEEAPDEEGPNLVPPLVLAGGGALIVGGVISAILAKGARDELDSSCAVVDGRRLCPSSASGDHDRDTRASVFADVLFVAGAATLGVGLWLLLRKDEDAEDEAPEVTASIGRGAAALVVRGRF